MVSRQQRISTITQAVRAYGGAAKITRAFRLPQHGPNSLDEWQRWDAIPKGYHLALYLGLLARGCKPMPTLFGVRAWDHLTGVRDIPYIERPSTRRKKDGRRTYPQVQQPSKIN